MSIEGTWSPVEATLGGQALPPETLKTMRLTMREGHYVVQVGEVLDRGTYRFLPATHPKALNITSVDGPNQGKTLLAIYELTGDRLRVGYDLSETKRPAEFRSDKEHPHFLAVYRRERA